MDLTHFNPNSQKEADFVASFVARQSTLDFLLKQLSLVQAGQSARHHLIVAPRGFGKTSLLRRIAIGVRSNAELNARFIPLRFREEQHNVISLDVLWRNCLQSLLEAREDEGATPGELDALDADWAKHAPRQGLARDEQDGEPAWHTLQTRCAALQRRPVLLIDNLDTLLAGLSAQHQWGLRKRLQADDGPVLLAAASRYPEATHNAEAAFYEFFRIQTLDKLDNHEVFTCLRNIAAHRGLAGQKVLVTLDNDPGRVAALNTLAGGNPRTLSVLYGVLESHLSGDVLSQLSAMLDTFTGWYQARTEELPMQARAVFDALALHWDPMTAAALGLATGLDTPAVSSQLSRLEKTGYVEAVALSRRKASRNGYQVSERFFNIWYLMRNGPRRAKQSIRFLTTFLQSCFSNTERRSMARAALQNGTVDPGYVLALATSLGNNRLRGPLLDHAQQRSNDIGQASEYKAMIDGYRAEWRLETRAGRDHASPIDDQASRVRESDHPDARSPAERVARHLFDEALRLGEIGQLEQAMEVYGDLVARFGAADELALREQVARALFNKGITLGVIGRAEQSIEVYDDVIARFGAGREPALREAVARAHLNKGVTLGTLGRTEQAIDVYDQAVARFGEADEPALRDQVARVLFNKGVRLSSLGRSEQAIKVYGDVLARFGAADEPAIREVVARALVNTGIELGNLGRSEQAIVVYAGVVARLGAASEPALRELVAKALVNTAITLAICGRSEQAIGVCDDVLTRFGAAGAPALRELVARALFTKGVMLQALGRSEHEVELAYRSAIERQPNNVGANNHLGNLLLDFKGDPRGARKAYEDGLAIAIRPGDKALLHLNLAYLLALHGDDLAGAQDHVAQALLNEGMVSTAGRKLLEALSVSASSPSWDWPRVFAAIGAAVDSDDRALWSEYADDLERLLWHVIAQGKGADFKQWMQSADYPTKYAPLYHAFVAALDGEDHLLQINPETREPAAKIHAGIARRLKLYGRANAAVG